eukprot:SAG31_NODE_17949_length_652_cov_0.804702_1_plen_89_part_00
MYISPFQPRIGVRKRLVSLEIRQLTHLKVSVNRSSPMARGPCALRWPQQCREQTFEDLNVPAVQRRIAAGSGTHLRRPELQDRDTQKY